jgi:hypothetical protein
MPLSITATVMLRPVAPAFHALIAPELIAAFERLYSESS